MKSVLKYYKYALVLMFGGGLATIATRKYYEDKYEKLYQKEVADLKEVNELFYNTKLQAMLRAKDEEYYPREPEDEPTVEEVQAGMAAAFNREQRLKEKKDYESLIVPYSDNRTVDEKYRDITTVAGRGKRPSSIIEEALDYAHLQDPAMTDAELYAAGLKNPSTEDEEDYPPEDEDEEEYEDDKYEQVSDQEYDRIRSDGSIVRISVYEYCNTNADFDKETLYYYPKSGHLLLDEDDEVRNDLRERIGIEVLSIPCSESGSKDNSIYVRDPIYGTDYEVIRSDEDYIHELLDEGNDEGV